MEEEWCKHCRCNKCYFFGYFFGQLLCDGNHYSTGCKKTSPEHAVTINCKIGQDIQELTAYPNPSSDFFVLNTLSAELQNGFITLYDLAGKMLERIAISGESIEVARNLPPGVYFAKLESGGEIKQVLKLVKN
jgi:hypothetical protein